MKISSAWVLVAVIGSAGVGAAVASAAPLTTGVPGASPQAVARDGGSATSGLSVTPARALFETRLAPGAEEFETATLRNDGDTVLDVGLSARLTGWDTNPKILDVLELSALRTDRRCDSDTMSSAAIRKMSDVGHLGNGTLRPGEETRLCVRVALPASHAATAASTSLVDLVFTHTERPAELAFTGFAPARLTLMAISGVLLGCTVALARRISRKTATVSRRVTTV